GGTGGSGGTGGNASTGVGKSSGGSGAAAGAGGAGGATNCARRTVWPCAMPTEPIATTATTMIRKNVRFISLLRRSKRPGLECHRATRTRSSSGRFARRRIRCELALAQFIGQHANLEEQRGCVEPRPYRLEFRRR